MEKKDKTIDELINALYVEDQEDSPLEESHRKLYDTIRRKDISACVTALGEEVKDSIWQELNSRIIATRRHRIWMRFVSAAAAVALLLGLTNYISYMQGYRQTSSRMVNITNPSGLQSSIVLTDGTRVWLNRGTTLTYPAAFTSKNREVAIEGEAFFEVASDKDHPFIVHAEKIDVRVLGTKFNVKNYTEEASVAVTLEEGRVEASLKNRKKYELKVGEQLIFDKTTCAFRKMKVNPEHYSGWKEGKLYFNCQMFEQIAKQLEQRFNVQIHIASESLKQTIFTGDFVRNENLEQILHVIAADKRIHYRIEGNQVYIK